MAFGASFIKGRFAFIFKLIFIFAIILVFSVLVSNSWQLHNLWRENEVSKFLLPPYTSIDYFLFYVGTRFFAPYGISLVIALLFLWLAKFINQRYHGRFFYDEECYFGALGIFLSSHPGWLFYAIFLLFIYLLTHFFLLFVSHSLERLSLYYLWLPAAISVIIIDRWLQVSPIWQIFKF